MRGVPGQKGQLPPRPAGPSTSMRTQVRRRTGIRSCVSCTFKAAFEGMKSSRFFHFRKVPVRKGEEGRTLGGTALVQQSCCRPAAGLLPFENRSTRNPSTSFPQASHISVHGSQERGPKSLSSVPVSRGASFLGKHSLK